MRWICLKLLKKIILYIKGLFVRKVEPCCRLDSAYNAVDEALRRYPSPVLSRDVAVSVMVRRHLMNIKAHLHRMRKIIDADVFNLSLEEIILLCDRIRRMDSVHKSLILAVENILFLLNGKYDTPPFVGDELVYYGVTFGRSKEYYYLSDNMPLEEGQYVLVLVGDDMENKVAKVDGVYRFTPTNAPYPADKLKTVIKILV
jgi:hypothetical protein